MKLRVANQDVTGTLGTDIARAATERATTRSPRFHVPEVSALSLRDCRDEAEYFRKFMHLMRLRHGAATHDFDIQRAPGLRGAVMQKIRCFLWKLLAYQHDRMIFQQNLINEMIIHSIEFETAQRDREIARLRAEVQELRAETGKAT